MSDDARRKLTDPATLADFEASARKAAAEAMRSVEPDVTDAEIAARLDRMPPPAVHWVKARITAGTATTPDELAELRRHLPGGANRGARPGGTNAVDDAGGDATIRAIVADLRRNHRKVQLGTIAATSGTFTRDNLRYWMRANGKRLSDYL